MKRSKWPLLIGALVIGALAGVALAGRPETLPSVVIPASTVAAPTTTVPAEAPSTTVAAPTTTVGATSPSTSASAASTTSVGVATRTASVVAVNASGRAGQASRAADVLLAAGWPPVVTDDARDTMATSRVMAKPGFEAEARLAADDLGLTVEVEPYSDSIATIEESTGDVMVFLGSDVNF